MSGPDHDLLTPHQWAALESSFHQGSAVASEQLAKWIGKPSVVEIDSLVQLPLAEATTLLSPTDSPICFCWTEMRGLLSGHLVLAFDDASGFALADMLIGQPQGTVADWTEMAISAAVETTNILACAYFNTLSTVLARDGESSELLPAPPEFNRDFAASLMEFVLMDQAVARDEVILARTKFEIDATPLRWTLLLVPDAASMSRLADLLPRHEAEQ